MLVARAVKFRPHTKQHKNKRFFHPHRDRFRSSHLALAYVHPATPGTLQKHRQKGNLRLSTTRSPPIPTKCTTNLPAINTHLPLSLSLEAWSASQDEHSGFDAFSLLAFASDEAATCGALVLPSPFRVSSCGNSPSLFRHSIERSSANLHMKREF